MWLARVRVRVRVLACARVCVCVRVRGCCCVHLCAPFGACTRIKGKEVAVIVDPAGKGKGGGSSEDDRSGADSSGDGGGGGGGGDGGGGGGLGGGLGEPTLRAATERTRTAAEEEDLVRLRGEVRVALPRTRVADEEIGDQEEQIEERRRTSFFITPKL